MTRKSKNMNRQLKVDRVNVTILGPLTMVAILVGCSTARETPQTDIVFQVYPADPEAESALGFVNADGTNHLILERATPGGMLPVWSPDGTQIAYRQFWPLYSFHYYGQPAVVGRSEACQHLGGNGRVRWVPDGSALLTAIGEQQSLTRYRYAVVSVDPEECKIVDELYVTLTSGFIHDPDLSPSGLLAFTRGETISGESIETECYISVVDLETEEEWIVGGGVVPSWSPNSEYLAYTGLDGIYVVRADGTENHRVFEYSLYYRLDVGRTWSDWPPLAEWSPDGKWLVYHREEREGYAIYKLNLETGEETLIVENGLNPDWRSEFAQLEE